MANQPKVFNGKTEDAEAPFLDAGFWIPDTKIMAIVERSWMSSNGECYVLNLAAPVKINKLEESRVSIGNLTGFRMAMDAAGLKKLLVGDFIEVECTGIISPKKQGQSPRPNFAIKVTRPASADPDEPF
jgi:hypothetical protein